jgi:hypothetical protein
MSGLLALDSFPVLHAGGFFGEEGTKDPFGQIRGSVSRNQLENVKAVEAVSSPAPTLEVGFPSEVVVPRKGF